MKIIRKILLLLLCLFFVVAGINHFRDPEFYLKMMPPYLPWHLFLVYLSGVLEIVLGVMVVVPRFQRIAAWGLIALLIAVFPANIHLATHPEIMPNVSPTLHLVRLPFQLLFIAWAWLFTRAEPEAAAK